MAAVGPEAGEKTPPRTHASKPKVCILGGGVAGLTTAWALTQGEGKDLPFEIHLYQMGWRMGGKGRTGRQRGREYRVIEHGLHALGGYYHNTFRMLRKIMKEEGLKAHFQPTSRVAFPVEILPSRSPSKSPTVGTVAYNWPSPDGSPHAPDRFPGEPGRIAPSVASLIGRMARYLEGLDLIDLPGTRTPTDRSEYALPPLDSQPPPELRAAIERRSGTSRWKWDTSERGGDEKDAAGWDLASKNQLRGLLGRASRLAEEYGDDERARSADTRSTNDAAMEWLATDALAVLEAKPDRAWPEHAEVFEGGLISASRAERQALWRNVTRLCLAAVVGVISSGAITKGLQILDCIEFRDFLRLNGASERTVRCGVVKGIYDYAFAYEDGDPERPSLAAGVAVRFMLLFFLDSVGGLQFHMKRGMGESLILPIYQALENKICFHPYYEARSLSLSEDGRRVAKVSLHAQFGSGQSTPRSGGVLSQYQHDPDQKFWPDVPEYLGESGSQQNADDAAWALETAAIDPQNIETREDFDFVVLAIPPAAHEKILPDVIRDKWKVLFDPKHNVATISAQVWGDDRPTADAFILVGRDAPIFQSVADMKHQLEYEVGSTAKHLYYLVGACTRPDELPSRATSEELAVDAADFFFGKRHEDLEVLKLKWKSPGSTSGSRCDHVQRNDRPADLYVRSAPHTISKRPDTKVDGVDNLILAGDWVRNGVDFGCVEAAVISGIKAANVILERLGGTKLEIYEAGGPVMKKLGDG